MLMEKFFSPIGSAGGSARGSTRDSVRGVAQRRGQGGAPTTSTTRSHRRPQFPTRITGGSEASA